MRCVHCGLPVYRTNQGDWIDETEGDGCLQTTPENDVHEPDMTQVDGYVFDCIDCKFYGENETPECPDCGAEIPSTFATPFSYERK